MSVRFGCDGCCCPGDGVIQDSRDAANVVPVDSARSAVLAAACCSCDDQADYHQRPHKQYI